MGKLQLGHIVNLIVEDEIKDGYILSNGKDEILLPTDDKTIPNYRCFVHKNEQKDEPRLGSLVAGRVIDVKDKGMLNVSLLPRKY